MRQVCFLRPALFEASEDSGGHWRVYRYPDFFTPSRLEIICKRKSTRFLPSAFRFGKAKIVLPSFLGQHHGQHERRTHKVNCGGVRMTLVCERTTKKIFLPNLCAYLNPHAFSISCSTSSPPTKTTLIRSLDSTTTHSSTCLTSRSSYSMG